MPVDNYNYEIYFYDLLDEKGPIIGPVIGRSAEFRNKEAPPLKQQLRPIAAFLHPESPYFSAQAYLKAFHDTRNPAFTENALQRIRRYCSNNANQHQATVRNAAGQIVSIFLATTQIEYVFSVTGASFKALAQLDEGLRKFDTEFNLSTQEIGVAKESFFRIEKICDNAKMLDSHLGIMQILRGLKKVRNYELIASNL